MSRTLAVAAVVVGLAFLSGLIAIITSLRSANRLAADDAMTLGTLQELETQLLLFSRAEALGDPPETRARIERRIHGLVRRLVDHPHTRTERASVRALRGRIDGYLARRRELSADHLSPSEALAAARPAFDDVRSGLAALRTLKRANLERARQRVESIWTYTLAASIASGLLLVASIVSVYGLLSRNLLGPLDRLRWSIRDLRNSEVPPPVPETGPKEIQELARALNLAAASLARQREKQATFMAGVVHDLRTPLGALAMGLEQLREDPCMSDNADNVATLSLLSRQSDRLMRMLDDLGEMSRIESGRLSLDCKWHDIREAAREIVDLYRPTTSRHRLDLMVPSAPVLVWADPTRTEEVLSNLVSNAIKYSPDGGTIAVSVEQTSQDIVVSVADPGVGIPPDQVPDLFRAFMRGRSSGEIARGSGLGLSVVSRIVKAHGGHIDVTSKPGKGSTFRVRFPARTVDPGPGWDGPQRTNASSRPNLRMR